MPEKWVVIVPGYGYLSKLQSQSAPFLTQRLDCARPFDYIEETDRYIGWLSRLGYIASPIRVCVDKPKKE